MPSEVKGGEHRYTIPGIYYIDLKIKRSMEIDIHKEMINNNLKSKMILQVHDELVFDVYKEELDFLSNIVKDKMINALPLNVPIEVNLNTGTNWLEAH